VHIGSFPGSQTAAAWLFGLLQNAGRKVTMGISHNSTVQVIIQAAMALAMGLALSCSEDNPAAPGEIRSSRSYQGHASDTDINNFVKAYPHTVGTRLDDCQTCHKGGMVMSDRGDVHANPCDYCHYVIHPPQGWTGLPASFSETLNAYGSAYDGAGREGAALDDIDGIDSDGDGFINSDEIDALRYPGDGDSYPGLELCAMVKVTMDDLLQMPSHTQFGLANTTKQQFDFYATYTGVKIKDLLEAAGVDLTGATSIDILSPDGYARSFTVEQITGQYPDHRFWDGFDVDALGADCAFVDYPPETYNLGSGDWIGTSTGHEQWHILAWQRDGIPLEKSYLDPITGRIIGEGPLRNIVPPGSADDDLNTPDRGKNQDNTGCTLREWDFNGDKDHNAGSMIKGAVIIRINPMPSGCEEFDIINGGWSLIDEEAILIYGHGVPVD
jgi:hypothetical protein